MGFFKSKAEKDLDEIISDINMNMSNNYKDAAQEDFEKFKEHFSKYISEGGLGKKSLSFYEEKLEEYGQRLEGYSHKDQKPYWT